MSHQQTRILVLSNRYHPDHKGGYDLQCQAIAQELARRGYDVHVLTSRPAAPPDRADDHVHRLLHLRARDAAGGLSRRWQHAHWAIHSRQDYRAAYRLMHSLAPDLVYIWNMGHLALSPLAAARDLDRPLVFALADYWLLQRRQQLDREPDPRRRRYRRLVYGLASLDPFCACPLHALSSALKQQYVDAGFAQERIAVIPWGLPAHLILDEPPSLAGRAVASLLYAGRLSEEKGVHLAIEAVALLRDELAAELGRPAHLDIVGSGEAAYVGKLQTLVAALDLQPAVRFLGKLDQAALLARYQDYDAVLMPHTWLEPFGAIAIEAMARGACVIASDRGGPAEIISAGRDGLLTPPGNSRALARAIVALEQDPERKEQMRRAAIATVRQRYTFAPVGDQVEALLQAALDQARRKG